MYQQDLKWWLGLIGSMAGALVPLSIVPHPYDKVVLGICAVCAAGCAYMITPAGSTKDKP